MRPSSHGKKTLKLAPDHNVTRTLGTFVVERFVQTRFGAISVGSDQLGPGCEPSEHGTTAVRAGYGDGMRTVVTNLRVTLAGSRRFRPYSCPVMLPCVEEGSAC
jgi:hypothetical protein